MTSPTLKEPTGSTDGGAAKWGGPDAIHCAELIKGTHATERIQASSIETSDGSDVQATIDLGTVQISKAGGTGSGTQADTALMQTSLEDAEDNGKVLVFPPGTWLIQTGLKVTKKIHILIESGATVKFADAATINVEADFDASNDVATSWSFPMFSFRVAACSGSILECYGHIDGNQETIGANYGTKLNSRFVFVKDCDNVVTTGNFTLDNMHSAVWMVDSVGSIFQGASHAGNTVTITLGEFGAIASLESCTDCRIRDIKLDIASGNQALAELVDFNAGCWRCSIEDSFVRGLNNNTTGEAIEINGGGETLVRNVHGVNVRKMVNIAGNNTGVYTSDPNQTPVLHRHILKEVSLYVEAAETFTADEPIIDCNGIANAIQCFDNIRIEYAASFGGTITADPMVMLNCEDGTAGGIHITGGASNTWNEVLNLDVGRANIGSIRIIATIATAKSLLTIADGSSDTTFGLVNVRQNTSDTTSGRTGIDLGTATALTFDRTLITVVGTTVANWVEGDENSFISGTYEAGHIADADVRSDAAIATSKLAVTGTPDGTKFWRDDDTWVLPSGSGDVVKVGTPVDSQIGVWTGDGTIEGDVDFTFDTATNTLAIGGFTVGDTSIMSVGGVNILVDSPRGTMTLSNIDAIDATTAAVLDIQTQTNRLDEMAAPTGAVAMNAQLVSGVADPVSNQDAVTKAYFEANTTTLPTLSTNQLFAEDGAGSVEATKIDNTHLLATLISGHDLVTAVSTDMLLLWDATDSALKRCDASDFLSAADNLGNHTATEIIKSVTFGLQGEEATQTIIGTTAGSGWTYSVPTGDDHVFEVNSGTVLTVASGQVTVDGIMAIGGNTFQFNDSSTTFVHTGLNIQYDVATSGSHVFRVNNNAEVTISGSVVDIGLNALRFGEVNQDIIGSGTGVIYDTPTGDTHDFHIAGASELVISETVVNAAGSKFQEAGVNISPIGVHDVWVGASAMWESTTGGCAPLAKVEIATDVDIQTLDFDGASIKAAQFEVALPKNWDAGTITATFYWSSTATDTDDVDWRVSGASIGDNVLLSLAYGAAITVTDAHNGAASELNISSATAAITIAGAGKSEMCRFLIERVGSADTMAEDARLHGVMLHMTCDASTAA